MQFKSLINQSFLVLMLDLQEQIQAGWEIDVNNLPVDHFVYKEVHLVKDDEDSVKDVFVGYSQVMEEFPELGTVVTNVEVKKSAGRPKRVKA